jgi:hypothetical protein
VAALIFLTTSEKRKSTSSNVIQVRNWQKPISTEEKLDVICQLEKGKQTVDLCHYVTVIHSSVRSIQDNADGIKGTANSGTKLLV